MNRSALKLMAAFCLVAPRLIAAEPIGFNESIRPILSDNCFACHGPDAKNRKGKLRLDMRDAAIEKKAIVPGDAEASELVKRIFTEDSDDLMPPPDSHKVLTTEQKDLLKRWVAEGAVYQGHWAYLPPVKPKTPPAENGIDFLVGERLRKIGLTPSAEADRRTLIRRLYFDLIGLPPKPAEVEKFEKSDSPDAYRELVEHLLSLPQYGERMAIPWLDVVRFADTIGYHSDTPRNIWPYRNYVIEAFNKNKPFDQFTREQIAGDLLPHSTQETKVGSAFNRLLLTTEEGGAQPKDYEARMLTDRVRAIGAVWLGSTIGCAQCHDHKFDPIKQKDFYSMGAFFADIREPIIGRREDGMLVPNKRQAAKLASLEEELHRLQRDYDAGHEELQKPFEAWQTAQLALMENERFWMPLAASNAVSAGGAHFEIAADRSILVQGKKPDKDTYRIDFTRLPNPVSGLRLEALPHDSLPMEGSGRSKNGNFVITEVAATLERGPEHRVLKFASARATFEQTFAAENNPQKRWAASAAIDGNTNAYGWAILPGVTKPQQLVLELADPLKLETGDKLTLEIVQNHGAGSHTLGHFRVSASSSLDVIRADISPLPPAEITTLLQNTNRTEEANRKLFAFYKTIAPELAALRADIASSEKARSDFEAKLPRCLVSVHDEKPRTVRVLPRGNFLVETGEIVQPALPAFLVAKSSEDRPLTRLDLAEWLVSRENPLTARVIMNRLWKQFFGTGLSKVLDDFGAQGEPPSNQRLLDWLACEFMDSGWDMKHMVRLIVNSRTYRQTSVVSPELRARDPYNRELAAQNRWRLDAELVRDNALSVAGLLVLRIGGPSAKPYQPDGYWENLNFPVRTYEASRGADQYRRGLYTWWQRSYLHPAMLAFDAPTREECAAERNRSNIPQQALVLLNDPSFVEASRAFAERILSECRGTTEQRIAWAWQQALQRSPRSDEVELAKDLVEKQLAEYSDNPADAGKLVKVGLAEVPSGITETELAAWSNLARVILNLHETITRS